jgi:hypothetical protein
VVPAVQEDVILSLLEAQLSVISVGILPKTIMMYIAVLSLLLLVLLPYTVVELLSIGPIFLFEYTTLHNISAPGNNIAQKAQPGLS